MDPNITFQRVLRLARLDTTVFDEVRDDANELIPSLVVAAVACLLAGLGSFLWWETVANTVSGFPRSQFLNTVILGSAFLFASLYIGGVVAWVVLAQAFKVQADLGAVLRTFGYAAAPLALSLLMLIPILWPVFAIVPLALVFVMMIYGLQSVSNADSRHVVLSVTAGFASMILVAGVISALGDNTDAPMGAGQFGQLFDLN